jgi:hypothetical protein
MSRYWWLRSDDGFVDLPARVRGDSLFEAELELTPGKYVLGVGRYPDSVRVKFEVAEPTPEVDTNAWHAPVPATAPVAVAPVAAPVDVQEKAAEWHGEAVARGVNVEVLASQQEDNTVLNALGISPDGLFYPQATEFIKLGYDIVRKRRKQLDGSPGPEAAHAIADKVASEERDYHRVKVGQFTPRTDGLIEWKDSSGRYLAARPSEAGWHGLLGSLVRHKERDEPLFQGGARYLVSRPAKQRAWNVRRDLESAAARDVVFHTRNAPDGSGERQIYHVSSSAMKHFGGGRFARTIAEALPKDAKVEGYYDPATTKVSIDARWAAPGTFGMGAGSITEVGMKFETSDLGDSSYKGWFQAFWSQCLNALSIGEGRSPLLRTTHKASVAVLRRAIQQALHKGNTSAEHFRQKWGYLGETSLDSYIEGRADRKTSAALEAMQDLQGEKLAVARVKEAMRLVLTERAMASLLTSSDREKVLLPAVARGAELEYQDGFLTGSTRDLVQSMTRTHQFAPVPLADSFELLAGRVAMA